MEEDFLRSLRYIGFTARIKRLSDMLVYDAKEIYKHSELEIEPNWHMVLLLLKRKKELTITEIARALRFSHPGIIKITTKMKDKGYLISQRDKGDSRKSLISLSKKSLDLFPEFEKKWDAIQDVVEELVDENFLEKLMYLEKKLATASIYERFNHKMESNG